MRKYTDCCHNSDCEGFDNCDDCWNDYKQNHKMTNADRIRAMSDKQLTKTNELSFLFDWVREADLCGDINVDILRILWTAYCFHHGLDVDTAEYDNVLLCIYNSIVPNDSADALMSYDEFDAYMAHYLV